MFSYPNQQEHNDMIDLMRSFANTGRPQVGIFWYDYAHSTLLGVQKDMWMKASALSTNSTKIIG